MFKNTQSQDGSSGANQFPMKIGKHLQDSSCYPKTKFKITPSSETEHLLSLEAPVSGNSLPTLLTTKKMQLLQTKTRILHSEINLNSGHISTSVTL